MVWKVPDYLSRCSLWLLAGVLTAWIAGCSQHYEEGTPPPSKPLPAISGVGAKPVPTRRETGDSSAAISGILSVSESIADNVPSGATLYIIGRKGGSSGPPYAIQRLPVPPFPYRYTLTSADAGTMMGQAPSTEALPPLYVVAKIDQDGLVGAQPGDMEGSCQANPLAPGEMSGDIVIDQIH